MTNSNKDSMAVPEGMRDRKRRQTRGRISSAAMSLFLKQGYEATTVDQIAAAADVSKRSFFDYFPSKEHLISGWQDDFGVELAAATIARPARESLCEVAEEALVTAIAAAIADPQRIAIDGLIRDTPSLRARDHLNYAKLEQALADALAGRVKNHEGRLRARIIAMLTVGILRVGSEEWVARGRAETIEIFIRRMFRIVWNDLAPPAKSRLPNRRLRPN